MQLLGQHKHRILLLLMAELSFAGASASAQPPACGTGNCDPGSSRQSTAFADAHPGPVSAEVRKTRDEFWMKEMPDPKVPYLDPDSMEGSTIPGAEITDPFNPNSYWLVGTFLGYDLHKLPNGVIYTEVHLRINRVVDRRKKPRPLHPATIIDVDMAGDCVILPDEEIYHMRPGHRYVVNLRRAGTEDFFQQPFVLADVTSGTALPVTPAAIGAMEGGRWSFTGLTEEAAIKLLQETAAKNN